MLSTVPVDAVVQISILHRFCLKILGYDISLSFFSLMKRKKWKMFSIACSVSLEGRKCNLGGGEEGRIIIP